MQDTTRASLCAAMSLYDTLSDNTKMAMREATPKNFSYKFIPEDSDDCTIIQQANEYLWAMVRRKRAQARTHIIELLEKAIKAKKMPKKPDGRNAYATGHYIAQLLMRADSWEDPDRRPYLVRHFKERMKCAVRPNSYEPPLEGELSYSGIPNFRAFTKCADYNAGTCSGTGGHCGTPEEPRIHVCDRKMLDGHHCSRPHPHIRHDEFTEREECVRDANDIQGSNIFKSELFAMRDNLMQTATAAVTIDKNNTMAQKDVEERIQTWLTTRQTFEKIKEEKDDRGQKYNLYLMKDGIRKTFYDATEYDDTFRCFTPTQLALSDNYMSSNTDASSQAETPKKAYVPQLVYHPKAASLIKKESASEMSNSDSDIERRFIPGTGRGAFLRDLQTRRPGAASSDVTIDSDSSGMEAKSHLRDKLVTSKARQGLRPIQETSDDEDKNLPHDLPNTAANLQRFMDQYGYKEVISTKGKRVLVPRDLPIKRAHTFIAELGRKNFQMYKGAGNEPNFFIPRKEAQQEWEEQQTTKSTRSLNSILGAEALKTTTKKPTGQPTNTRDSAQKPSSRLWRIHGKPGELITMGKAPGLTNEDLNKYQDTRVEVATELRDFNAPFLEEHFRHKHRYDPDGQPARPTYSNGAPHYGCWKQEQPGGQPTQANCTPVFPAGIRIGDMALPNHISVKKQPQFNLGTCIYSDSSDR